MELSIGYFLLIFAALGLAWVAYKLATSFKDDLPAGRVPSDEERTKQLIEQARIFYPELRLTDALDRMFELSYMHLVVAKKRGDDIQRFIRDRRLIVSERLRIWHEETERRQAEVERESSYNVKQKDPPRIHPILRR